MNELNFFYSWDTGSLWPIPLGLLSTSRCKPYFNLSPLPKLRLFRICVTYCSIKIQLQWGTDFRQNSSSNELWLVLVRRGSHSLQSLLWPTPVCQLTWYVWRQYLKTAVQTGEKGNHITGCFSLFNSLCSTFTSPRSEKLQTKDLVKPMYVLSYFFNLSNIKTETCQVVFPKEQTSAIHQYRLMIFMPRKITY